MARRLSPLSICHRGNRGHCPLFTSLIIKVMVQDLQKMYPVYFNSDKAMKFEIVCCILYGDAEDGVKHEMVAANHLMQIPAQMAIFQNYILLPCKSSPTQR